MPLAKLKLLTNVHADRLQTDIANYIASQPSLRAQADTFVTQAVKSNDENTVMVAAVAHAGLRKPAGTAVAQPIVIQELNVPAAQAKIDSLLANAVHATALADTTVAGHVSVTSPGFFESEDVGRSISVGGQKRTITSLVDAQTVTYAGAALPSSASITCNLLGAEYVTQVSVAIRIHACRVLVTLTAMMEGAGEDALAAAMAAKLNDGLAFFHCYIRSNGDDNFGDGTLAFPVKTLQRVCDALERAGAISGSISGFIVVHHGSGTFNEPGLHLRAVPGASSIYMGFVCDQSDPVVSFTMPAMVAPPNPDKPSETLACTWDLAVPAYVAAINKGTHWIQASAPFGADPDQVWNYGLMVDDVASVSPNLRVITKLGSEAWAGIESKLREIDTFLLPAPNQRWLNFINDNEPTAITVFMLGFRIGLPGDPAGQISVRTKGVNFYPCSLASVAFAMDGDDSNILEQYLDFMDTDSFSQVVGGSSTFLHGIWRSVCTFAGSNGEFFIHGSVRNQMFLGGVTGGRAGHGAYELEGIDIAAPIINEGANIRIGNHQPASVHNTSVAVQAQKGGRVEVVHISGATSGPSFQMREDSILNGDGAWALNAVDNLTNPGQEIQVDDVVMSFARVAGQGSRSNGEINAELTTTDATVTEALRVKMPVDGNVKTLAVDVSAVDAAGVASYARRFTCRRASGTTTVFAQTIGTDNVQGLGAATDVTATVSGTDVLVNVKGVAATTIKWHVRMTVQDRR